MQRTSVDYVRVRSTASFGENVITALPLGTAVTVISEQEGDRWMPVEIEREHEGLISGYISKNVLRDSVTAAREALMAHCVYWWFKFEHGKGQENKEPYTDYVGEFWQSIGYDLDGQDRDQPWSAAFISHVVHQTGVYEGFDYSPSHARYCHPAIKAKLNGESYPFLGYRLNEYQPQLGDMVCAWRLNRIDYDYAALHRYYASHCDIVVAIQPGKILCIGGNVGHSVRHSWFTIDNQGFLLEKKNLYAVLKNTQ